MLDLVNNLFTFVQEYVRRLYQDIPADQMNHPAIPGGNTPHWILGHLTICNDLSLKIMGLPGKCKPEWMAIFGPGSSPSGIPAEAPGKAELLTTFFESAKIIQENIAKVPQSMLEAKHSLSIDFLKEYTPTYGLLLAHLLTTHPTTHLGQLSSWRRAMNLPGVLG